MAPSFPASTAHRSSEYPETGLQNIFITESTVTGVVIPFWSTCAFAQ